MPRQAKKIKKTTKKAKPVKKAGVVLAKISRPKRKRVVKKAQILEFGHIGVQKQRILVPLLLLNFLITGLILVNYFYKEPEEKNVPATPRNAQLEAEIREMVKGYPIEKMVPLIASKDKQTAAFLVAIAKKESAWGKRRPVLAGADCFNYWGFRMDSERMGSGGHTCFDSPRQAVNTVASRIDELVKKEKVTDAKRMIVWKCGYGCLNEEKSESEKKWIKDVGFYYQKLIN